MAGIAQMGVDVFWNQIQKLQALSTKLKADLLADKAQLTALWSATKRDADTKRAAANQKLLAPLIHQNSTLRVRYQSLAAKFNEAVAAARATLERAGYRVPANLSGMGVAPLVVIGGVAVAALGTAFLIYQSVRTLTDAQRTKVNALARWMADPTLTPEQRERAFRELAETDTKPLGTDLFKDLTPVLAIIALVALLPMLLPPRRAA